jgi:hypothetical protein
MNTTDLYTTFTQAERQRLGFAMVGGLPSNTFRIERLSRENIVVTLQKKKFVYWLPLSNQKCPSLMMVKGHLLFSYLRLHDCAQVDLHVSCRRQEFVPQ